MKRALVSSLPCHYIDVFAYISSIFSFQGHSHVFQGTVVLFIVGLNIQKTQIRKYRPSVYSKNTVGNGISDEASLGVVLCAEI